MWAKKRTRYGNNIVIDWVVDPHYQRGAPSEPIDFVSESRLYMIPGIRGSAKSSLAETLMEEYLDAGSSIMHMFGANEGEGLASLRSRFAGLLCPQCEQPVDVRVVRNKKSLKTATYFACGPCGNRKLSVDEVIAKPTPGKKFLILHGSDVELEFEPGGIPAKLREVGRCDMKPSSQLTHADVEKYDIILSTTLLYSSPTSENENLDKVIELMMLRPSWKRVCYNLVLEAADLFFSRLKTKFVGKARVKEDAASLLRKIRHQGFAMALDTQRYLDIDKSIRVNMDFTMLKTQGVEKLPDELSWIYIYVSLPTLQHLPRSDAIVVNKEGSLGSFRFKPVPWHKVPGEDMLALFKIKRRVLQPYEIKTDLTPLEHFEIVHMYKNHASMMQVANIIAKSRGSMSPWTVDLHIRKHNEAVQKNEFCPLCKIVPDNGEIHLEIIEIRPPRVKPKETPPLAFRSGNSPVIAGMIEEADPNFREKLFVMIGNLGFDQRMVEAFGAKYENRAYRDFNTAHLAATFDLDPVSLQKGFKEINASLDFLATSLLHQERPELKTTAVSIILDGKLPQKELVNTWIYDYPKAAWVFRGTDA
jgi:hypothetical protein